MGGQIIAESATQSFDSLKDAWGKGDDVKALGLIKVFTLAMVTRWFWMLDGGEAEKSTPQEIRRLRRETGTSSVLALLDSNPDQELEYFKKMDNLFKFERDWSEQDSGVRSRVEWG